MVTVHLPDLLSQLVQRRTCEIDGSATLAGALSTLFARHPVLERCILKPGGALRDGVSLFLDGREVVDRTHLGDPIGPDATIRVATRTCPRRAADEIPCGWAKRGPDAPVAVHTEVAAVS